MSSTTLKTDELVAIAMSGSENMICAAEEREQKRPHTFLSLAPTTSASYPSKPTPKSPMVSSNIDTAVDGLEGSIVGLEKTRRSSSLSSTGSLGQKRRFLKLGPVHHGVGEEGGDWSEDVIE